MPEEDADFLLSLIKTTLKDIMTTVSGQFIIYNDANNQYYIDVDKIVDYDEKIKQKASIMADGELNRYFYDVVYRCLEWDAKQYVTNFNIYEYDLNWDSHNIFREGYLFMGLPEREAQHSRSAISISTSCLRMTLLVLRFRICRMKFICISSLRTNSGRLGTLCCS
jgi:hypothetical protein